VLRLGPQNLVAPMMTKFFRTRKPSGIWQLSVSSQHMVKSLTLNPYMSLFKLCSHIWSKISILDPLTLDFWSVLVWTFTLWVNCGGGRGSVGPATYFLVTDGQKSDYLSRASQRARSAIKNFVSKPMSWNGKRWMHIFDVRFRNNCFCLT